MSRYSAFVAAFALAMTGLSGSPVAAETVKELSLQKYLIVWKGKASIPSCVHERDVYLLGEYIFVCDKGSYDYPHHYGEASIVARNFDEDGSEIVRSFVCMEGQEHCVEGTVYQR